MTPQRLLFTGLTDCQFALCDHRNAVSASFVLNDMSKWVENGFQNVTACKLAGAGSSSHNDFELLFPAAAVMA